MVVVGGSVVEVGGSVVEVGGSVVVVGGSMPAGGSVATGCSVTGIGMGSGVSGSSCCTSEMGHVWWLRKSNIK